MSDRWIHIREGLLDLTPLSEDENLAAICNGNYWIVCYGYKGERVLIGEGDRARHLSMNEAFTDLRVKSRIYWCPHCMKSIPLPFYNAPSYHIATCHHSYTTFREVLETRSGYFEELYFQYPESYKEYKEQALYWIKYQSLEVRKKLNFFP